MLCIPLYFEMTRYIIEKAIIYVITYKGGRNKMSNENDSPSIGFAILCFLIPLLGLILYLVWKDDYPLKAKSCGKGAIIGVVASIVLGIASYGCLMSSLGSIYGSLY